MLAGRMGPNGARRIYAIGLILAAIIYVGFALAGRASPSWLALESLGVFLCGTAAWVGARRWPMVLALGWAAHAGWDLLLHRHGAAAVYTPAWYPPLCAGFDLVVAGAVLGLWRR